MLEDKTAFDAVKVLAGMKLMITWIFLLEEEYLHSYHHCQEGSLLNHQILHKIFLGKSLSFLHQGFSETLEGS